MSNSNFSQLGNKYILLDLLGIGGMAEVYRCKLIGQKGFEKIIVLKKLLPEAARDKELVENFIDEARLAALLQHENIGHVYDFGEIEGNYFIAMEYLFGKDLFSIVQSAKEKFRAVEPEAALFIAAKICEGMGYAHALKDLQGKPLHIIHRDLSPHNVFVTYDGKVKIIDFGVARAELFDNRTRAGVVKGKISYMSPEQLTGKKVDQRSDIFSIGILLYEMLSGKRMYEGDTATLIRKSMQAEYEPLEKILPGLPKEAYAIVAKALQVKVKDRFQTCAEMSAAIDDYLYQLKERPSSQKLKKYMSRLFKEEHAAEKAKLLETASKIDGEPGTGGGKSVITKRVKPPETPDQEDKTLIVDTFDDTEMQKGLRAGKKGTSAGTRVMNFLAAAMVLSLIGVATYFALEKKGQWNQEQAGSGELTEKKVDSRQLSSISLKNKDVDTLLGKAEEILDEKERGNERFIEASRYYQQALKIEPGNGEAFEGMRRIYETYATQVNAHLAKYEFPKAQEVVRSAQRAFPGSERIAALGVEIQKRRKELIADFSQRAERAFANNDLTTPVKTSAFFYYQKVLEFDNDNTAATKGIQKIADRYAAMAEESYDELSLSQAHIYADRGLAVAPESVVLQQIQKKVLKKFNELVQGYLAKNDFQKAEAYIESALSVYPKNKKFKTLQASAAKKKKQLVSAHLKKANAALKKNDLTTPSRSSAHYYFGKVLEYDQGNKSATRGLQNIANRYGVMADGAYRDGNYARSAIYVERGLSVVPKHDKLQKTKKKVVAGYDGLVKKDLAKGDLKKAENHVSEFEKYFPQERKISSWRKNIEARKKQIIKGLRLKAQRAMSSNNLTTPAKTSAYAYYKEILKLDSNNGDAKTGLRRIADKYAVLADNSYKELKFPQARVFVDRGLKVMPKHKRLLELKKDLSRSKPGAILNAIKKNIKSSL